MLALAVLVTEQPVLQQSILSDCDVRLCAQTGSTITDRICTLQLNMGIGLVQGWPIYNISWRCLTDTVRLYYTILYYTILYYTILYYTILYYTILYYTTVALYYTTVAFLHYMFSSANHGDDFHLHSSQYSKQDVSYSPAFCLLVACKQQTLFMWSLLHMSMRNWEITLGAFCARDHAHL